MTATMIWPVAALAIFLLGFVVVYASMLESRVETDELASARAETSGESSWPT